MPVKRNRNKGSIGVIKKTTKDRQKGTMRCFQTAYLQQGFLF